MTDTNQLAESAALTARPCAECQAQLGQDYRLHKGLPVCNDCHRKLQDADVGEHNELRRLREENRLLKSFSFTGTLATPAIANQCLEVHKSTGSTLHKFAGMRLQGLDYEARRLTHALNNLKSLIDAILNYDGPRKETSGH